MAQKSSESLVPAFLLQSALLNPPEEVKELITRICNYACELEEGNIRTTTEEGIDVENKL